MFSSVLVMILKIEYVREKLVSVFFKWNVKVFIWGGFYRVIMLLNYILGMFYKLIYVIDMYV